MMSSNFNAEESVTSTSFVVLSKKQNEEAVSYKRDISRIRPMNFGYLPSYEKPTIMTNLKFTMPCKNMSNGGLCTRRECMFAHSISELSPLECGFETCRNARCKRIHKGEEKTEWASKNGVNISFLSLEKENKVTPKYKVCRYMHKKGGCTNDNCGYAHTLEELEDPVCSFNTRCLNKTNCKRMHSEEETSEQYRERVGMTRVLFDSPLKRLEKSRMCFREECDVEGCTYAHSDEELQDPECIEKSCSREKCSFKHSTETISEYRQRIIDQVERVDVKEDQSFFEKFNSLFI